MEIPVSEICLADTFLYPLKTQRKREQFRWADELDLPDDEILLRVRYEE